MERAAKRDPYRLVGTILGRYQIHEFVGVGGMGAVYRATHQVIEDIVALKILKPDLAYENEPMVQFFFKEAKNTRRLNHPFIVRVTDADISNDGIAFLIMEWLEGYTLEDELKEKGVIPVDRVAMLLDQISKGLTHAHNTGIIHRDLKPSNIMIVKDFDGNDTVKILDFGIAKAVNSTIGSNSSRLIGAPFYSSPEQMTVGANIDQRSDIYSIGVMLYQLLSGVLPFDANTVERLIQQHFTHPPPSLCQIRPDISEEVESVVFKALAKKPEDRYQTIAELASAMRHAADLAVGTLILDCVDEIRGEPVANAAVYLGDTLAGQTDEDGQWRRALVSREISLEINHPRYQPWKKSLHIVPQKEQHIKIPLVLKALGDLMIQTSAAGSESPIAEAQVWINGELAGVTDERGFARIEGLTPGEAKVEVVNPANNYTYAKDIQILKWQESTWVVTLPAQSQSGTTNTRRWILWAAVAGLILLAIVVFIVVAVWLYLLRRPSTIAVTATPTPTSIATPMPSAKPSPKLLTLQGSPIGQLSTTNFEYYQTVISSDGTRLASTGDKNTVRFWRVEGENKINPDIALENAKPGSVVAISPSGSLVAGDSANDNQLHLWRTDDGRQIKSLPGHTAPIVLVRFNADEKSLLSADLNGTVIVWQIDNGKILNELPRPGSGQQIMDVSADQTMLVLWSQTDGSVQLWSLPQRKVLLQLRDHYNDLTSAALSPNGNLLALGSGNGTIRFWDVRDDSLKGSLEGGKEAGEVSLVLFMPGVDAEIVAAGFKDGSIRFWQVSDRRQLVTLKHDKAVGSLSFSANGKLLVSEGDDGTIRFWRIDTATE